MTTWTIVGTVVPPITPNPSVPIMPEWFITQTGLLR